MRDKAVLVTITAWLWLCFTAVSISSYGHHQCLLRVPTLDKQPSAARTANDATLSYLVTMTQAGYDVSLSRLQFKALLEKYCPDNPCDIDLNNCCEIALTMANQSDSLTAVRHTFYPIMLPVLLIFTTKCCHDDEMVTALPWTLDVHTILYEAIQHEKWTDVIFLYDVYKASYYRAMVQTLSYLHVGVVHVPLVGEMVQRGDVNLTHIVPSVATSNYPTITVHHVILCVSPTLVNSVLQEAHTHGLLGAKYRWLILCPVEEPLTYLTQLMQKDSNVLLLQPHGAAVEPLPCSDGLASDVSCGSQKGTQCQQTTGLYTFTSRPQEQFTEVATWRNGHGWTLPLPLQLFSNVFTDFGNRLLIIGTIPAKPFVIRQTVNNETVYTGFCMDLLRTMASQLNFRYKIVESPDNKYGAPEEGGGWNGMVGMVARKEVHMGVGPYTITSIRETVIDFSVPYMEDGGGILTKKDDSTSNVMAGLGTFSNLVWLTLVGTTVAVGVAFYIVVRVSPYARISQSEKRNRYWSLWSCVLHITGSFMMQGIEKQPRNTSARVVLGFWWVFITLIVSMYTATLTSTLTVDLQGNRIDSIEDLAKASFQPLVLAGSVWDTLFQTATEGVYKQIAKRMHNMPEVTSDVVALEYVMAGKMAFLHDVNNVKYMYAVNCKELHLAASIFNSNGFGLILPEDAPYKDAVNNLILRLQEGGFLEKWRAYWWPLTTDCETQAAKVSEAKQIGLSELAGLLVVYVAVVAVAVLSFLLALCLHKTDVVGKCRSKCAKKGRTVVLETLR